MQRSVNQKKKNFRNQPFRNQQNRTYKTDEQRHNTNNTNTRDTDHNFEKHQNISKFDARQGRRGVSVFQRQLFKRKRWVAQYEDKKDQKRRDKRKKMRHYFRALKDLNREHIKIFGHSISTHSKSKKKRNHISNKGHGNHRIIKRKDVWHELRHPSYHQRQKLNQRQRYKNNIHLQSKMKMNFNQNRNQRNWNMNQNENHSNYMKKNDERNGNNNGFERNTNEKNRRFNSNNFSTYAHAQIEGERNRRQRERERNEREIEREEKRRGILKYEKQRERRNKIMSARTKKGQPRLNSQMILLLEKIQYKQKIEKLKKEKEMIVDNDEEVYQQNMEVFEQYQRSNEETIKNESLHSWNSFDSESESDVDSVSGHKKQGDQFLDD